LRVRAQHGSLILKHRNRRPRGPQDFVHPEFAQALEGSSFDSSSIERRAQRKTQQLCRQVQRSLNLALADRHGDEELNDLYVAEVSPAPNSGHLLVHVVVPTDRPMGAVLAALRRNTPRLRWEVGTAINRKRAPELSFVPALPKEEGYE
jgi:ribosome-binding factor A